MLVLLGGYWNVMPARKLVFEIGRMLRPKVWEWWQKESGPLLIVGENGIVLAAHRPRITLGGTRALHYDIRRGPHSVGVHVRDAASYVCWAFGRAYCHSNMRTILEQLAPHLLVVACYDREVNYRRAASAAFQENVGRQGNYPHGIEIVNTADCFALSSRVNSYLHLAVCIAECASYFYPFVDKLLCSKICHWLFLIEGDYIQLRDGAQGIIAATAAILLKAIKKVDVVILTVGHALLADETKIIAAIKEAGANIKEWNSWPVREWRLEDCIAIHVLLEGTFLDHDAESNTGQNSSVLGSSDMDCSAFDVPSFCWLVYVSSAISGAAIVVETVFWN
ncbi:hypothetical protein Nepgr_028824 [Nepenthes gracilis]|uniref:Tubulin-folding cofactor D ARM repeats domain-containing protein n=1 Tax=Nepenthes gracilis TaxID=150966 RepID=A0AAD3TD87_NEPGR|nr:hypothetical protein Nepgr_028824 [Nepenthes gracilis]